MKKSYILIACLALGGGMQAQGIEEILRNIETNNKQLQALHQGTRAAKMEVQTANNLADPSVEYSPFYTKGVDGMSSSELVVSQEFDFPTRYWARRQAGNSRQEALDRKEQALRRDILLEAKNLCLDLVWLGKQQDLLDVRKRQADDLLALAEKRLQEGDAGILDVNKIKLERMGVQTEVSQNRAAFRTALQQLLAMNGNLPLEFNLKSYPEVPSVRSVEELYDEVMASDADLLAAGAEVQAATKDVNLNKQNWLPKLSVGYRRNTALDEKSNGFLVGGSLPLFSNRKKLKIARAQETSARLALEDLRLQAAARVHGQFNELKQLEEAMQAYDVPLMYQTLDALEEAVSAGQMSVIDYYVTAADVYRNLQVYLDVERQYHRLMAEVYKNRL